MAIGNVRYTDVVMLIRIRATSLAPSSGFKAVSAIPETTFVILWSTVSGWLQTLPCGAVMYVENV